MMQLDDIVGELQGLLDELGVADNPLVMFSTDNGAAYRPVEAAGRVLIE